MKRNISLFSPGTTLGGKGAEGFTLRTTIAAAVGGTASELGGGKFANGAVSGAFVHMFNAEVRKYLTTLNARQLAQVERFDRFVSKMDLKTFNKYFGLNISNDLELRYYKLELHKQFVPIILNSTYNMTKTSIETIGGTRSSSSPIKAFYRIIVPGGTIGFDFEKNTINLRGIYEID